MDQRCKAVNGMNLASKLPSDCLIFSLIVYHQTRWLQKHCNLCSSPASAVAMHGKIYVAGGLIKTDSFLCSVECYDPVEDKWTKIAKMNHPRANFGLFEQNGLLHAMGYHESIERYNPLRNKWIKVQTNWNCLQLSTINLLSFILTDCVFKHKQKWKYITSHEPAWKCLCSHERWILRSLGNWIWMEHHTTSNSPELSWIPTDPSPAVQSFDFELIFQNSPSHIGKANMGIAMVQIQSNWRAKNVKILFLI